MAGRYLDHCRIGSLEMSKTHALILLKDHCRIGSLENALGGNGQGTTRSLPHRQLRNWTMPPGRCHLGSLPHRQLRKIRLILTAPYSLITAA